MCLGDHLAQLSIFSYRNRSGATAFNNHLTIYFIFFCRYTEKLWVISYDDPFDSKANGCTMAVRDFLL